MLSPLPPAPPPVPSPPAPHGPLPGLPVPFTPASPPPGTLRAVAPYAAKFAAGVGGLVGIFEVAAPLIGAASNLDPAYVFPARVGAAAAIGCAGATAVTLMDYAYQTVSVAKVRSLDHKTPMGAEIRYLEHEHRYHLAREIVAGCIAAGSVGALLGGLIAVFPVGVMYTLAGAVGLSLAYGAGSTIYHTTRAVRGLRRTKLALAIKSPRAARKHLSEYRYSVQKAGAAALESLTIAAVTHHMIAEVGHMLAEPGHHNGAKVVASSAEQLPGALESVAEVAEALSIGAREAREAAVAARQARTLLASRKL